MFLAAFALFLVPLSLAAQEQFVTFAVFNLDDVITAYFEDSSTVRQYQDAEEEYRAEMQRLEEQLLDYQQRRAEALEEGEARTARRLREDIEALEEDIATRQESWYARRAELRGALSDNQFYRRLYSTVQLVAENGGYTGVLEETAMGTALFWYSSAIDITQDVIDQMLARY
jgi:Skp family chaperone for outer membrane proteins